jgi:hypothetical protein
MEGLYKLNDLEPETLKTICRFVFQYLCKKQANLGSIENSTTEPPMPALFPITLFLYTT